MSGCENVLPRYEDLSFDIYRRKVLSGMKESFHDLILQTSCPMDLPCAQRDEWLRKEQDVTHCRLT